MNSMKNAVVVVLLLGVAYGAYTVINTPDPKEESPETLAAIEQGIMLEIPDSDEMGFESSPQADGLPGSQSRDSDNSGFDTRPPFSPPPTQPKFGQLDDHQPPPLELKPPTSLQPPPIDTTAPQTNTQNPAFDDEPDLGSIDSITPNSPNGFDPTPKTDIVPIDPQHNAAEPVTKLNWDRVNQLVVDEGNYRAALTMLSRFHRANPNSDQRDQVLQWLDALAFKVIYSTENNLHPQAYVVSDGDTLQTLAARWRVPAELIYRVNKSKIGASTQLPAGAELKVIPGPFDAEIDRNRNELTLYLKDMYAGRFSVEIGSDANFTQTEYRIKGMSSQGRVYQDTNTGQTFAVNDINNPYGQYWFGLDETTCLHSTSADGDSRGCIRLADQDAAELFSILSTQSKVIVR